jgi:DNA modification methylase
MSEAVRILIGDVRDGLRSLPDRSVHCCVTSPPYWGLRDYGVEGQIGMEPTPEAFVASMVEVFAEVRRVLRDDGTLWLNIGDSYAANRGGTPMPAETLAGGVSGQGDKVAKRGRESGYTPHRDPASHGLKHKDLCMIPWRVALALQADGWWLRSVIVWAKKSPMPESITDRPTSSWEPIFLLAKSERYFYDHEAVKESGVPSGWNRQREMGSGSGCKINGISHDDGVTMRNDADRVLEPTASRNQRNVWHLGPEPLKEQHFAAFPSEIPRRAIKAGTSEKGCCPACGAPWRRVVQKPVMMNVKPSEIDRFGTGKAGVHRKVGQAYQDWRDANPNRTLGWEPTCGCDAGAPVPCLVLDPFLGSGTTVAVARQLGRHGVGCELNPEYAELARVRIGKAERPGTFADQTKEDDSPLFAAERKEQGR